MASIEDIQKLREAFRTKSLEPKDDLANLSGIERTIKRNIPIVTLRKNAGVAMLLEYMDNEVKIINDNLLTNRNLTDFQRAIMFKDKDRLNWFRMFFDGAEKKIENGEKQIDEMVFDNREFMV